MSLFRRVVRALSARRTPAPALNCLPVQPEGGGFCADCWAPPGCAHELSCPAVSLEQAEAFMRALRGTR
jgi:hypothetical protein